MKLIIFSTLFLIYSSCSYAWEEFEQRAIDNGCWRYDEKKVNPEFLRCFRFELTNIYSGRITKFSNSPSSLLGCIADKDSRWCELHLISKNGFSALSIWLGNDHFVSQKGDKYGLNSVIVNEYVLGDICSCQIKEWAIETDRSVLYSRGDWSGKGANPLIETIIKANSMAIYATIPNRYKTKYRLEFTNSDLADFKKQLNEAINYTGMGN